MSGAAPLPAGTRLVDLARHTDDRGSFTEIFRHAWGTGVEPVQWNLVHSDRGVLRGVHVHPVHDDYLLLAAGRASVGLCDLREETTTPGLACCIELDAARPTAIVIPHGVAHGFLFREPSTHIYAVSHYWDTADELGCRWDDPGLGIPWPTVPSRLSPRDEALPGLEDLREELRASWSSGSRGDAAGIALDRGPGLL